MKTQVFSKLKYASIIVLFSGTTLLAPTSLAFEPGAMFGPDMSFEEGGAGGHFKKIMGRKFKRMAKYLELTDEQKEQMKTIRQEAKTEGASHKTALREFREQARELTLADNFDESAFSTLQAQYQSNFQQLGLLRAKTKHAMMQVLTEEQQAKWQEFKPKRGRH